MKPFYKLLCFLRFNKNCKNKHFQQCFYTLILSTFLQYQTNAQTVFPPTAVKTDSILSYKDSLHLQNNNEKLYLVHKLKKGQTLFQLADFFKVSVEDLRKANPQFIKGTANSAGQYVQIPITLGHLVRRKGTGFVAKQHLRVYYRVKQNETLYHIAKTTLNLAPDTILVRNRIKLDAVKTNTVLHTAWIPINGIKVSTPQTEALADSIAAAAAKAAPPVISEDLRKALINSEKQKEKFLEMGLIQKDIIQKGVAYWAKEDTHLVRSNTTFFALHNQAAIGTTVKVYNPMYRRTLYMKVIGRIPQAGYSPDITIVLSPYAAKTLGAVDSRFHIEVTYLR